MPEAPTTPRSASMPAADQEDALAARLVAVERGESAADGVAWIARHLSYPSKRIRRLAAGALSAALERGDADVATCRGLLESGDAHTRWGAAFALSRAGFADAASTEAAVAHLDCEDGDVRWAAAAIVVAGARDSAALREILRGLAVSGSARARKMALLCLCDCGAGEAALFIRSLADADRYVRMAALTSLARGGHRDERSLAAIAAVAAEDAHDAVRRAASAVHRRLTAHLPR